MKDQSQPASKTSARPHITAQKSIPTRNLSKAQRAERRAAEAIQEAETSTTTKVQTKAIAVQEAPPTMLALLQNAIINPKVDVSKMRELMELQKEIMAKNAELAFNAAIARLNLPILKHTAKIEHTKGNVTTKIGTYTKYEDMDRIIRPIYQPEGFSFSFDSRANENNTTTYFATLHHAEGHSRSAQLVLPADVGGAKNAVQAVASTVSYAKRYLVQMLLNIVTEGEDDDGDKGGTKYITPEEAIDLEQWAVTMNCRKTFLGVIGAEDFESIKATDHGKAQNILREKQRELQAKGVKV